MRAIDVSGLMAWVSDVAEKVTPTVDRVKAHDAVCAAALAAGETPLPIRFGQTFADDASVAQRLAARESVLRVATGADRGLRRDAVVVTRGRDPDRNASDEPDGEARAAWTWCGPERIRLGRGWSRDGVSQAARARRAAPISRVKWGARRFGTRFVPPPRH